MTFFQIALTGYELIKPKNWPVAMLIASEVNSVLLVFYSACNPCAYCGDLLIRKLFIYCYQCCGNNSSEVGNDIQESRFPWRCHRRGQNVPDLSEYDAMKSIGITLGGPDPIGQQLHVSLKGQNICRKGYKKLSLSMGTKERFDRIQFDFIFLGFGRTISVDVWDSRDGCPETGRR